MKYKIKSIRIQTTVSCNLKCKHCFAEAGAPKQNEITINDFDRTLEDLKKMGTKTAVITGGEPMARKDFVYSLASALSDIEIVPVLYSNMTIFNGSIAKKLQESGVYIIQTSIDAPTAKEHNLFRGKEGCFEKTVDSIKLAKKLGFQVWTRTTLTKQNAPKIPDILQLMLKLKVDSYRVRPVITLGRANEGITVTKDQLRNSNAFLLEKKHELKNQLEIRFLPFCFEFTMDKSTFKETIPCFETQGYISATGEIRPCAYYPVRFGNIREDSLFEAWNGKLANDFRKKTECKECFSCAFYPGCHGGCRAAAYCRTKKFSGQDPLCLKNK